MKNRDTSRNLPRRDRLIRERVHDPYKTRLKLREPTVCPQCGAVYHRGRWTWANVTPEDAAEELCQACHRINDGYPAGEVVLSGDYIENHREEILNLARNVERLENGEHPLHRIIEIQARESDILITTTDIHLPRRIGQALFDAWEGNLNMHYDDEGYIIRVEWKRTA
jgi:hypothetical protein